MVLQQRGIVVVKNIAQAQPCGSIFSFCSENKNLGTGVTPATGQFWPISPEGLIDHRFQLSCAFILPTRIFSEKFWNSGLFL
jgi:hypothetical protein